MDTRASHYDVLVVGAGLTGVLIAAQLAERGVRVALVDALGAAGSATRRSLGLVAPQPSHWQETMRGVELMHQLCKTYSIPARSCRIAYLATHDEARTRLLNIARLKIDTTAQWHEALPIHQDAVAEGLLTESGLLVDLEQLRAALLRQHALAVHSPIEIESLERGPDAVYALAQGYTLPASWIVLATNAFAGLLSPYLGDSVQFMASITWRSQPRPAHAKRFEQPIVVDEGTFALIPLEDNSVHAMACSSNPAALRPQLVAMLDQLDAGLLSYTAEQSSGVLTKGSDGMPLVGQLNASMPVLYAIGLGPFGAAWAPIVCERVLALMQTP